MKRIFIKTTAITLLIAFVMICVLMLSGCGQSYYDARNIRRMTAYMPQYQAPASALANQLWPCFTGKISHSDTVTTFGPPDVVFKKGDTVEHTLTNTVVKTVVDTFTITKKVLKQVHDTIPDERAAATLTLQLKASDNKLQVVTGKYQQLQTDSAKKSQTILIESIILGVIGLILLIWGIVKVYAMFTGGAEANAIKKIV